MQNVHVMRPAARAAYEHALREVVEPGVADRPAHERAALRVRFERHFADLWEALASVYATHPAFPDELDRLLRALLDADRARRDELRALDHEREITPDWLHREQAVGYVTYVDRFAGTLAGVRERLGYLRELGISYLHLMPLLHARPAPNDGGYAVVDYGAVDPRLGTMEELAALADELRAAGMSLCVDVVLNHTAREHAWAQAALAGDPEMRARYLTFPDRTEPDRYERTLPEVFPETAPGSFTWVPEMVGGGRWVWTTFNPYQWDLDYANPAVFRAMAEQMLGLANAGVDVMRLDAVPFLWKRAGTDCQNQPEVHDLLQALRSLMRIAAPAVAFKAEAIVAPQQLVAYLGTGRHEGRECDLAYHNSLMVLLWSSLASGRAHLITHVLARMPPVPRDAGWITYVRCHDDIGWAVTDEDAAEVGESGPLHRRFLVDFYAGRFPGSTACGAPFQEDPRTGDARTSGTCAALAGLEAARAAGDPVAEELAIRRILLLHAVAFTHGGLPVLYMGDELGLPNDTEWREDPVRAEDNRWMHRPAMDWAAAGRRTDPDTVEGRLWAGFRALVAARRGRPALHAGGRMVPVWTGNDHVLGLERGHDGDALLLLANLTAREQMVERDGTAHLLGAYDWRWVDLPG